MPQNTITLHHEQLQDVVVLYLNGRLDAVTSTQFEQYVSSLIEEGHIKLVFNLEKLDYISSAGLRVFLLSSNLLRGKNGKMNLAHLKVNVEKIFTLAGFDQILSMLPTQDDALKALAK